MRSRVQSLGVRSPRRAWGEESDDEGGFLSRTIPRLRHAPSAPPTFAPAYFIQERGVAPSINVVDPDPESHGSASNWNLGYGSGSASKSDRSRSASVWRWHAKMYEIWAYLSTFIRFWAFILKLGSRSASKRKVGSGSGSASRWQAGSGSGIWAYLSIYKVLSLYLEDPDPDPHQGDKQDPDPHQQHCLV
jgi:hypothetical protein